MTTSRLFIRHGDTPHDVITTLYQVAERFNCEIGRTHVDYAKRIFIHENLK
jgi:hypothetical protein